MGDSPGVQEDTAHASTPRTPRLTVTFDQREEVHCVKRNAHAGWLWRLYFLQTPSVFLQFPKPEKDATSLLGGLGVSLDSSGLQSYFLFSLIQLILHSGRGTHGSESPEVKGKGTILPFLPLTFHARLSPYLTEGLTFFLTLHWFLAAWVLCLLCGGLQKFRQN